MSTEHECPYGATHERVILVRTGESPGIERSWQVIQCGQAGWLCNRCREDRADARIEALVNAIVRLEQAIDDASGMKS